MGRLPLLGLLPSLVRRLLVLAGFVLCLVAFGFIISTTVDQLMVEAPTYRENLAAFAASLADLRRSEVDPDLGPDPQHRVSRNSTSRTSCSASSDR